MKLHRSEETAEDRLRTSFERVTERLYPEEGIPMFLVCEDLSSSQISADSAIPTLTPLNEDLASALRRDADIWQCVRPGTSAADVCKIVEILADQNFGPGGADKTGECFSNL